MKLLNGREYHVYVRYPHDDGVAGKKINIKPLKKGLWCVLQTFYRMAQDPDVYVKDGLLKLVTFNSDGGQVLCAAMALEETTPRRTYYLQYTNGISKKTHDVATLDSGLFMAMETMFRNQQERRDLQKTSGGYFTICFYKGTKNLLNKAMLYMGG